MKKFIDRPIVKIGLCLVPYLFFALMLVLSSFKSNLGMEDFLKQLGINKSQADEKISSSILNGYVDAYGIPGAKNLAVGNRKAVVIDLLKYIKVYVTTDNYKAEYTRLKESNKPQTTRIQTPAELKEQTIASYKAALESAEQILSTADAANKPTFQKMVDDTKAELKKAEDPNNKMYVNYAKNYDQMMKDIGAGEKKALDDWEKKYPTDQLLFVKQRLEQFMAETEGIDFSAELVEKNGKKYFVNPDYERKSSRWKMAFRAGKEVVVPAREFVQQWVNEIK